MEHVTGAQSLFVRWAMIYSKRQSDEKPGKPRLAAKKFQARLPPTEFNYFTFNVLPDFLTLSVNKWVFSLLKFNVHEVHCS